MSVAEDLYDEELTLFKENYEEITCLGLKIFKLKTSTLFGLNTNQQLQQQIDQAEGDIVKVLARTTMQNCLQKIKSCNTGSRALDVILRLSLDLLENKINYGREVQCKVVEEESETLEKEIETIESNKIEMMNVLNDENHPERSFYLANVVENVAENVVELLVNNPIDDDELKVALSVFEIHYGNIDVLDYEILEQKLSKKLLPAESMVYSEIPEILSNLEADEEAYRDSCGFRSCLRTIQRLTNGKCTQVVDVRLMMLIKHKEECTRLIQNETMKLPPRTDLSLNELEIVTDYAQLCSEMWEEMFKLEEMLNGNDIEGKIAFRRKIFKEVTKLNDEEIELLDKVSYNDDIHDKICPVCLIDHSDNELLVSSRSPCKKERLFKSCVFKAMKEKLQCPCCRAYV